MTTDRAPPAPVATSVEAIVAVRENLDVVLGRVRRVGSSTTKSPGVGAGVSNLRPGRGLNERPALHLRLDQPERVRLGVVRPDQRHLHRGCLECHARLHLSLGAKVLNRVGNARQRELLPEVLDVVARRRRLIGDGAELRVVELVHLVEVLEVGGGDH